MARWIDDEEVERLIEKLAAVTGETPSDSVRTALAGHRARIEEPRGRRERIENLWRYLGAEVWPNLPPGRARSRAHA